MLAERAKAAARAGDIDAFGVFVLRDNKDDAIDIAPFHRTITNFVRDCWASDHFCGILAPWRHGKTLLAITRIALHEIGQNHNTRIRLVSAIDAEAMKRVASMRRYVTLSPEYRFVYPEVKPAEKSEWNLHQFYVERSSLNQDPTLSAAGVESNEAGGGYDIVMFDDVASRRNMIDLEEKRLKVFEQMSSVWLRRIDPRTRVVYAGTRWHADDPPGLFLAKGDEKWKWLVIGVAENFSKLVCAVGSTEAETERDEDAAILDEAPTSFPRGMKFSLPLWDQRPERWLREQYASDTWSFIRGYRQKAPRSEDRLFSDLSKFLLYGVTVNQLVAPTTDRMAGYDPAGEHRKGNALVTGAWGLMPNGSRARVITHMDLWRGSGQESATRVALGFTREKWELLVVENNATQTDRAELIRMAAPNISIALHMTSGQNKKAAFEFGGDQSLEHQVRNGFWVLCMDDAYDTGSPLSEHDATCGCAYHQFISNLQNYAPARSREKAYDLLMAWWFCGTALDGKAIAEAWDRAASEAGGDVLAADFGGIPEDEDGGLMTFFRER